ncbi:MAG: ceramidase domain-containing protein [Pseudomonadota bacterium]
MHEAIDIYCERIDASFWSEPINAITNGAFLVAALLLVLRLRHSRDRAVWWLTGLIAAIGVGSFLFHTYATGWAAAADVFPILLFMLSAVAIGLRRRFELPLQAAALGTIAFLLSGILLSVTQLAIIIPQGSVTYVPGLVMLILFAVALWRRGDPFAKYFLIAAPVFFISLTLRSVDLSVCEALPLGTHFGWHLLNAVTLYLVVLGLRRMPAPTATEPAT